MGFDGQYKAKSTRLQQLIDTLASTNTQKSSLLAEDGDTIVDTDTGRTFRLSGIDTPETHDNLQQRKANTAFKDSKPIADKATKRLQGMIDNHLITKNNLYGGVVGTGYYGRTLTDLAQTNEVLVSEGLAVPQSRYSKKLQKAYTDYQKNKVLATGARDEVMAQFKNSKEPTRSPLQYTQDLINAGLGSSLRVLAEGADFIADKLVKGNYTGLDKAKADVGYNLPYLGRFRPDAYEFSKDEVKQNLFNGTKADTVLGVAQGVLLFPETLMNSFGDIVEMSYSPQAKAVAGAKIVGALGSIVRSNAGLLAWASGRANTLSEERAREQGKNDVTIGEHILLLDEQILSGALERFAFGVSIGTKGITPELKEIAKYSSSSVKSKILTNMQKGIGGALTAGAVETAQEMLQEAGDILAVHYGVDGEDVSDLFTNEDYRQRVILGGVLGFGAGFGSRSTIAQLSEQGEVKKSIVAYQARKAIVQDAILSHNVISNMNETDKATFYKKLDEQIVELTEIDNKTMQVIPHLDSFTVVDENGVATIDTLNLAEASKADPSNEPLRLANEVVAFGTLRALQDTYDNTNVAGSTQLVNDTHTTLVKLLTSFVEPIQDEVQIEVAMKLFDEAFLDGRKQYISESTTTVHKALEEVIRVRRTLDIVKNDTTLTTDRKTILTQETTAQLDDVRGVIDDIVSGKVKLSKDEVLQFITAMETQNVKLERIAPNYKLDTDAQIMYSKGLLAKSLESTGEMLLRIDTIKSISDNGAIHVSEAQNKTDTEVLADIKTLVDFMTILKDRENNGEDVTKEVALVNANVESLHNVLVLREELHKNFNIARPKTLLNIVLEKHIKVIDKALSAKKEKGNTLPKKTVDKLEKTALELLRTTGVLVTAHRKHMLDLYELLQKESPAIANLLATHLSVYSDTDVLDRTIANIKKVEFTIDENNKEINDFFESYGVDENVMENITEEEMVELANKIGIKLC